MTIKKTEPKSESKEVTVVAPTRKIGDPGVIAIGGVILEPLEQVNKVNGPIAYNGVLLTDHDFTLIGVKSAKLSIYGYSVKAGAEAKVINFFIVADELSSLDIEVPCYMDYQRQSFTVVTLINSSLKNDYLCGSVVLINVESENNGFENSRIELGGHFRSHRFNLYDGIPKRIKLKDVNTYKLKFEGGNLPPGDYHDSEIIETTFIRGEREDSKRVLIADSTLRWSHFREGDIDIRQSTVIRCGFHFTGDVKLFKVTLENEHFGGDHPGIYMTSKFDLTDIDMAGDAPARMIRVNADQALITLPGPKDEVNFKDAKRKLLTMSFRNPNSRRNLRHRAADLLFGDTCPSEMEESVLDYFVDTVLSRCGMMNLMDTAQRLLSNNLMAAKDRPKALMPFTVGPRTTEIYGGGLGIAKEHDDTIYIDGNNLK